MRAAHPLVLGVCSLVVMLLTSCHAKSPAPDAHTVSATGSLSNRFVLADTPSPVVARLLIEAKASERAARPPVNLALVVDTSGSMEGRAIEDARAACKTLLSALHPQDRLAVIAFGSVTEVLLASTPVGDADLAELRAHLDAMKAQGTTDMAGGLQAGIKEVGDHFAKEGVNRVILLGDGDPNDEQTVQQLALESGRRGISISALGLGADYNESSMGRLAQVSGGTFHYVADSAKVAEFFSAEVVRLNKTFAKNASLTLVPGPGVAVQGVVGQHGATSTTVPLGDLGWGERREIVVKLSAPPHRAGAAVELIDAVLRYEDLATGGTVETRVYLSAHAAATADDVAKGKDPDIEREIQKVEAASAALEAIESARNGAVEASQQAMKKAKANGYQNDELERALPSPNPSPAAPAAPVKMQAEVVRRAHDEAMQVLQAH